MSDRSASDQQARGAVEGSSRHRRRLRPHRSPRHGRQHIEIDDGTGCAGGESGVLSAQAAHNRLSPLLRRQPRLLGVAHRCGGYPGAMFFVFSNRLGCGPSLLISAVATIVLLAVLRAF
jgi:hypothetical protein